MQGLNFVLPDASMKKSFYTEAGARLSTGALSMIGLQYDPRFFVSTADY